MNPKRLVFLPASRRARTSPSAVAASAPWKRSCALSYVDLSDSPAKGGMLRSLRAGVNWYFHSNSKPRFNHVFASANGGPVLSDLNVFETRFEFDFSHGIPACHRWPEGFLRARFMNLLGLRPASD